MFYAGNGHELIAFKLKWERDYFCFKRNSFVPEKANKEAAYSYPQIKKVMHRPYEMFAPEGESILTVFFMAGNMFIH